MIVDPWGRVIAEQATECGWVQAKVDLTELRRIRQQMPVIGHNRFLEPQLK